VHKFSVHGCCSAKALNSLKDVAWQRLDESHVKDSIKLLLVLDTLNLPLCCLLDICVYRAKFVVKVLALGESIDVLCIGGVYDWIYQAGQVQG
jgi:hypothetical protein